MSSKNIGIYIHIPFCSNKCFYCDYSSIITKNNTIIENYFEALNKEIDLYDMHDNKIKTIYIGGGTPSYVDFRYIEKIIKKISFNYDISNLEEFTIEMNPENVEENLLKKYKLLGINRISLGVQNTNDNILKTVNRNNDKKTLLSAVECVEKYFENYNIDFILGLPGETKSTVIENLKFITKYKPPHVSYYIYDNNHESVLNRMINNKKIVMPNQERVEEYADLIYDYFEKNEYKRYEISSWAIFDKESLHNKIYWENSEYIGFGVSAGGYYNSTRYVNTKNFSYYIKKIKNSEKPYEYYKINSYKENLIETFFMGLRLMKGIPIKKIKNDYPEYFEKIYYFLKNNEYFEIKENIRLSKKGIDYSSRAFEKILEMGDELP
ncbi:MAG: radical SAM family heme chaperone HemW [Thermotogota bacterium]